VAKLLANKVALVTGASRGIGRAIAQRLSAEGATVVIAARSLESAGQDEGTLRETARLIADNGGVAIPVKVDLEDEQSLDALIPQVVKLAGGLDILVHSGGKAEYAPSVGMTDETFDRTVGHYLRTPFRLYRQAVPEMRKRGAGWIVTLGSVTALPPTRPYDDFSSLGGATVYAAIKAAVHRMSQGLAAELLADNIAVNTLAPSTAIRTPGAAELIPQEYPTERIEYIAQTALALCQRPASDCTGLTAYSLHYPHHHRLAVYTLDGKQRIEDPQLPAYAHASIVGSGLGN